MTIRRLAAELTKGLDVRDKGWRVYNYQKETVHSALEIMGAMGVSNGSELHAEHIMRRVEGLTVGTFEDIYPSLEIGSLKDMGAVSDWLDSHPAHRIRGHEYRLREWWMKGRKRLDAGRYS